MKGCSILRDPAADAPTLCEASVTGSVWECGVMVVVMVALMVDTLNTLYGKTNILFVDIHRL